MTDQQWQKVIDFIFYNPKFEDVANVIFLVSATAAFVLMMWN